LNYQLFTTSDGSPTLYLPQWDEYYHSKHGAWQESNYVFIQQGLAYWLESNPKKKACHLFEMGFGTGLNAFLSAQYAQQKKVPLDYETIEAYPLPQNAIMFDLAPKDKTFFEALHRCAWEQKISLASFFDLTKFQTKLEAFVPQKAYDLIYYDAFGARVQPEMWSPAILEPLVNSLAQGGVFVTYAALGHLKRSLQAFGLEVEKLPGAPGKRHMMRAVRP